MLTKVPEKGDILRCGAETRKVHLVRTIIDLRDGKKVPTDLIFLSYPSMDGTLADAEKDPHKIIDNLATIAWCDLAESEWVLEEKMDNELDEIKQELAKLKETADGLSRLIRELTDSAPQGFAPADLLENAQEGFIEDLTTYGFIDVIKESGGK